MQTLFILCIIATNLMLGIKFNSFIKNKAKKLEIKWDKAFWIITNDENATILLVIIREISRCLIETRSESEG